MAKAIKTEINRDFAISIARVIATDLFERKSHYSPKDNAQRNLQGKTHYVDDSTLKAFGSRISSTRDTDSGLVFALVESVHGDYQGKTRGFRFVAFDLFGTVINDRVSADVNRLHKTAAKAEKEMWTFLDGFDVLAHYKQSLAERAERLKRESAAMAAISKSIKP